MGVLAAIAANALGVRADARTHIGVDRGSNTRVFDRDLFGLTVSNAWAALSLRHMMAWFQLTTLERFPSRPNSLRQTNENIFPHLTAITLRRAIKGFHRSVDTSHQEVALAASWSFFVAFSETLEHAASSHRCIGGAHVARCRAIFGEFVAAFVAS